jgi:hypothetical protein
MSGSRRLARPARGGLPSLTMQDPDVAGVAGNPVAVESKQTRPGATNGYRACLKFNVENQSRLPHPISRPTYLIVDTSLQQMQQSR